MRKSFYIIIFIISIAFLTSCVSETTSDSDKTDNSHNGDLSLRQTLVDVSSDTQIIDLKLKLETNPDDPEANYNLAMRYFELKRFDLANDVFAKAIELDLSNATYKLAAANSYADDNKISEAEALFKEILDDDENNTDALNSWGVMYYKQGIVFKDEEKLNTAEEKYNQVLEIDSENVKALFNLGLLYIYRKENEKAKEKFIKVNQLEPDRMTAIKHLASISLQADDWDSCREYSLKGMEIKEEPEFVYYLARVAYEKKEYKKAEELFEKFLGMGYLGPWEVDARARLFELKGI